MYFVFQDAPARIQELTLRLIREKKLRARALIRKHDAASLRTGFFVWREFVAKSAASKRRKGAALLSLLQRQFCRQLSHVCNLLFPRASTFQLLRPFLPLCVALDRLDRSNGKKSQVSDPGLNFFARTYVLAGCARVFLALYLRPVTPPRPLLKDDPNAQLLLTALSTPRRALRHVRACAICRAGFGSLVRACVLVRV